MQWHRRPTPLQTHTPAPVSSGVPDTGFYLMELSDETSRSESSVSLGGGGGSLSGTAVKAGDFRSPDCVMSRRQVSICTSRPRFMLHISMYSCRCRFMSFLAVASSSCSKVGSGRTTVSKPRQGPGGQAAQETSKLQLPVSPRIWRRGGATGDLTSGPHCG